MKRRCCRFRTCGPVFMPFPSSSKITGYPLSCVPRPSQLWGRFSGNSCRTLHRLKFARKVRFAGRISAVPVFRNWELFHTRNWRAGWWSRPRCCALSTPGKVPKPFGGSWNRKALTISRLWCIQHTAGQCWKKSVPAWKTDFRAGWYPPPWLKRGLMWISLRFSGKKPGWIPSSRQPGGATGKATGQPQNLLLRFSGERMRPLPFFRSPSPPAGRQSPNLKNWTAKKQFSTISRNC